MTDVLSDVLAQLDLQNLRCTRMEASGVWSFRFSLRTKLKFVALLKGEIWLIVEGGGAPVWLREGDTFLLTNDANYVVTSDPDLSPLNGFSDLNWCSGNVARFGGDDTIMIGGSFDVSGGFANFLLEALPKVIHIEAHEPSAHAFKQILSLLDDELTTGVLGNGAATRALAELLLVHALRTYSSRRGNNHAAWLNGLSDHKIKSALEIMHAEPGRAWTVGILAKEVGMSRSAFSERFSRKVGLAPLNYLTRWRLEIARDALGTSTRSINKIAQQVGYGSVSAFGLAFKRQYSISPGRYRKYRCS